MSTIESSNMTNEEYFRVNGVLSTERTESLLDHVQSLERLNVQEYITHAQEAAAQFPSEDFMSDVVSDLQSLCKRLRGDNRQELLRIIESMSDKLQCQFYSTDYGMAELRKIINTK